MSGCNSMLYVPSGALRNLVPTDLVAGVLSPPRAGVPMCLSAIRRTVLMAKCLELKHKDLSLESQCPSKSLAWHICNRCAGETGGARGLLASLSDQTGGPQAQRETPVSKTRE